MSDRPFKAGDTVALMDQRGTVLNDEKNGLVLVRVPEGAETWTADHCKLVMRVELTPYEVDVLDWHKDRPRKECSNEDRKDAQFARASLGYLARGDKGVFSITAKGLKQLTRK